MVVVMEEGQRGESHGTGDAPIQKGFNRSKRLSLQP